MVKSEEDGGRGAFFDKFLDDEVLHIYFIINFICLKREFTKNDKHIKAANIEVSKNKNEKHIFHLILFGIVSINWLPDEKLKYVVPLTYLRTDRR